MKNAKTRGGGGSSRNAIKHGLLAQVFLCANPAEESEFADLLEAVRQELQPAGRLEDLAAQQVAVEYWRLTRAQRLEEQTLGAPPGTQVGPMLRAFMHRSADLNLPVELDALTDEAALGAGSPFVCDQLHLRLTRGKTEQENKLKHAEQHLDLRNSSHRSAETSAQDQQDRVEMEIHMTDSLPRLLRYRTSIARELDRALLRFKSIRLLLQRRHSPKR